MCFCRLTFCRATRLFCQFVYKGFGGGFSGVTISVQLGKKAVVPFFSFQLTSRQLLPFSPHLFHSPLPRRYPLHFSLLEFSRRHEQAQNKDSETPLSIDCLVVRINALFRIHSHIPFFASSYILSARFSPAASRFLSCISPKNSLVTQRLFLLLHSSRVATAVSLRIASPPHAQAKRQLGSDQQIKKSLLCPRLQDHQSRLPI